MYFAPNTMIKCHLSHFLNLQGAVHQYWRSIRDDAVRRKKGKLDEHRIATRRRLQIQRVGHLHTVHE